MAVTTKSPMLLSRQRKRGRESRMRSCISSKWTTITRQVAKRRFGEESTNGHCTSKVHKHGFFHIKTQIIMTYGIKLPGVCAGRAPKGANTVQASVHGHRKGPQGNVTGQNDLLYIRLPSTRKVLKYWTEGFSVQAFTCTSAIRKSLKVTLTSAPDGSCLNQVSESVICFKEGRLVNSGRRRTSETRTLKHNENASTCDKADKQHQSGHADDVALAVLGIVVISSPSRLEFFTNLLLYVTGHKVILVERHGVLCAALGHGAQIRHILEHLGQGDSGCDGFHVAAIAHL